MLYVAVPVRHPAIGFVRLALPLSDVRQQLRPVLTATLTALGLALARRRGHRVDLLGADRPPRAVDRGCADRYRRGDLTPPRLGYGDDELGTVARALDDLGPGSRAPAGVSRRATARAWKRSSPGMVEGVIVVDPQARLQLVNDAARQMLKLEDVAIGRPYVETIRLPAIAELVAASWSGGRRRRCSCRRRAIRRGRSWPAPRRRPARRRTA